MEALIAASKCISSRRGQSRLYNLDNGVSSSSSGVVDLFTFWVALFALVESSIRGFLHGKGLAGALDHLPSGGPHEFFSKCLVVFVAFIPFFAFKELGRVLGKGRIWGLFFRKGPSAEAKLSGSKKDQAG